MMHYEFVPGTSQVLLTFGDSKIGPCRLWLPEGILTPKGFSGVYPHGMLWREADGGLWQSAAVENAFDLEKNIKEVEPGVLECHDIHYAKEAALEWETSLTFSDQRVDFSLSVHNSHGFSLPDVCAVLCLKFMDAPWWRSDQCFMKTADGIKSIPEAGWVEGKFPNFQKWNVGADSPYDNPAMNGIWTSNPLHAASPAWVVRNEEENSAIVFRCAEAYYIHCNRNNPCNDIALKFGNVEPGQTVKRCGYIELTQRSMEECFERALV